MADTLTPEQRRFNMSKIRGRDTAPEITVRRLIHSRGFRFRLHRRDLPGRPDIVLPRHKAVLFIHGCFWHGHDCPLFKMPASRTEFWMTKIEKNRQRDIVAVEGLLRLGWRVGCVWECALKGRGRVAPADISDRLADFFVGVEHTMEIEGNYVGRGLPSGQPVQ